MLEKRRKGKREDEEHIRNYREAKDGQELEGGNGRLREGGSSGPHIG